MSAIIPNPTLVPAGHPLAIAFRRRRTRLCLLYAFLSLVAFWVAVSAKTFVGHSAGAISSFRNIAGICCFALVSGAVIAFATQNWSARAVDNIASDSNVLAQWMYSADEVSAYVGRLREQMRWKKKDFIGGFLISWIVGVVLWGFGAAFEHAGVEMLGYFLAVTTVLCGSLMAFGFFTSRMEMASLPARFGSRSSLGVRAWFAAMLEWNGGRTMPEWTGNRAQLVGAEFTAGNPGQIKFTTRNATYNNALQVPVPGGQDDEARRIAALLLGETSKSA